MGIHGCKGTCGRLGASARRRRPRYGEGDKYCVRCARAWPMSLATYCACCGTRLRSHSKATGRSRLKSISTA